MVIDVFRGKGKIVDNDDKNSKLRDQFAMAAMQSLLHSDHNSLE
jgi:hypothetical protein